MELTCCLPVQKDTTNHYEVEQEDLSLLKGYFAAFPPCILETSFSADAGDR
jgi:hypothetical protein